MTFLEKLFALKNMAPFDRLQDEELMLVARVARVREYPAEGLVMEEGQFPGSLFVTVSGTLTGGKGNPLPRVVGHLELLEDVAMGQEVTAGEEGALCLTIGKSHFFTLVYECPEIVVGFLETGPIPGKKEEA